MRHGGCRDGCRSLSPDSSTFLGTDRMALSKDLLARLRVRRKKIHAAGGEEKLRARREKGLLSARERLEALFQPDSFQETGAHVSHSGRYFGLDK